VDVNKEAICASAAARYDGVFTNTLSKVTVDLGSVTLKASG
jgi:hypothetical protein